VAALRRRGWELPAPLVVADIDIPKMFRAPLRRHRPK
jgi:hypothetical protein